MILTRQMNQDPIIDGSRGCGERNENGNFLEKWCVVDQGGRESGPDNECKERTTMTDEVRDNSAFACARASGF